MVNKLTVRHLTREQLNSTFKCQASNTKLMTPVEKAVRLELLRKYLSPSTYNSSHFHDVFSSQSSPIFFSPFGKRKKEDFKFRRALPYTTFRSFLCVGSPSTPFSILSTLTFEGPHAPTTDRLIFISVKPLAVKILNKPMEMISDQDYLIKCEVTGSRPLANITWLRDKREFRRGSVSPLFYT